jgi:hypothetical protein
MLPYPLPSSDIAFLEALAGLDSALGHCKTGSCTAPLGLPLNLLKPLANNCDFCRCRTLFRLLRAGILVSWLAQVPRVLRLGGVVWVLRVLLPRG